VVTRRTQAGLDEQRSQLVAIQAGGMGLEVDTRPPNMHGRRVLNQALLLGVSVEAHDRAETSRHRGARSSESLEVPAEALDVSSTNGEET
jgi:hypothetical protein